MSFEIISDSSCDLTLEQIKELNINVVPFYFSYDGETYYKQNEKDTSTDFYNKLKNEDLHPKTSLPAVQDYCDAFEQILKQGKDIVCICLSSKLSGSYQSALNAKMNISEDYPDRRIEVIDSLAATSAQALYVKHVIKMRENNASIDDVLNSLQNDDLQYKVFFTVDSLEYLTKGGRIGKCSSLVGSLLDVKPILNHSDGELFPVAKVRKKKKAIDTIVNLAHEYAQQFENPNVSLIYCLQNDDITSLKEACVEKFNLSESLETSQLGCTIGVHTGPTAMGILVSNF